MKVDWKQALFIAGGAAATGVALYYLLRPEEKKEKEADSTEPLKTLTKAEILKVLDDIIATQERVKELIKEIMTTISEQNYSFKETCKLVMQKNPKDPLEMHGLTMADFDYLLEQHQRDPEIKSSVLNIMGTVVPPPEPSHRARAITVEELLKIHEFMRDELRSVAIQIQSNPELRQMHSKVLALAAQAFVGAAVKNKFSYTSDDVESAVMLHHRELASDTEFGRINLAIQSIMSDIAGDPM